jgi:type I restriction enzyme S subunit
VKQRNVLDNFEIFAEAPNSIPRLRELVAKLAVTGQLVRQDVMDEPISGLLNLITADKKKRLKTGSRRKSKTATPKEVSTPTYKLPNGWAVIHLGEWLDTNWGNTLLTKKSFSDRGFTAFSAAGPDGLIEDFEFDCNGVVISAIGARCGRCFVASGRWTAIKNTMTVVEFAPNTADMKFVYTVLSLADTFPRRGGAQPFLSLGDVRNALVPLPPLAEQHRIAAKVDELMALIDRYEAAKNAREETRRSFRDSALQALQDAVGADEVHKAWSLVSENMDEIFKEPEDAKILQGTLLKITLQGKLGAKETDPTPPLELLDNQTKMIAEDYSGRKRSEKGNGSIGRRFETPTGWKAMKLSEVAFVEMGNSPPGESYNTSGDGIPLINGPVEFSKPPDGPTIKSKFTTAPTRLCKKGDLIVCVRGATTGRTNIASFDACIGRGVAAIRGYDCQQYINLFMIDVGKDLLSAGQGTTFPAINMNDLRDLPIDIPSLAMQRYIVDNFVRIAGLCDSLEERLRACREINQLFVKSLLYELTQASSSSAIPV